ncbi:SDR family NAD(P)-dependent oxidoreductase [Nocardioides sp. B-3]|uniref:SDR family NAD(P)-dependent oxidoreductase n=1 Tax=Nocardioides sp. B-3 TaxID=2895565 RepID=UPI0021520AF0|nr:SDR family oxidoreductase [Nocardioides sp. B-3]UUZ60290.1 SDR family oxidoreductase [Nocardioides sp. B-3]
MIVTGGARGLGAAIAVLAADAGATVFIGDVLDATPVVERIRQGGGHATYVSHDVSDPAQWDGLVRQVIESAGQIDGLVNNAGVNHRVDLMNTSPSDWRRVMDINLGGAFYGLRAVGAAMDPDRGGSIVNMSSALGLVGSPAAAYSSAKWALRGLTGSACGTLAPKNIRVNSVHPGLIRTPMATGGTSAYVQANVALTPLGRMGEATDVANVVVFLLSSLSCYVSGAEIAVDGGYAAFGGQMEAARIVRDLETGSTGP